MQVTVRYHIIKSGLTKRCGIAAARWRLSGPSMVTNAAGVPGSAHVVRKIAAMRPPEPAAMKWLEKQSS